MQFAGAESVHPRGAASFSNRSPAPMLARHAEPDLPFSRHPARCVVGGGPAATARESSIRVALAACCDAFGGVLLVPALSRIAGRLHSPPRQRSVSARAAAPRWSGPQRRLLPYPIGQRFGGLRQLAAV